MSELGEISVSTLHHATLDRPKKPANMRVPSRPFLQAQLGTRDPGHVTTAVNSSRPKGKTNNKSSKVAAAPRMSTDSGREFSSSDEMSMNMSATKKQKTSRTRRFFKSISKRSKKNPPVDDSFVDPGRLSPAGMGSPDSSVVEPGATGKREKKIGHRKVDKHTGEVAYKRVKSSALMQAIQMGVRQSVGSAAKRHQRDLLLQDFDEVESVSYPSAGSSITPAHHFDSFKFYSYAPVAFRHFRKAFGIDTTDFLLSVCAEPLRELSNPGASGSVFYLSHDDTFIIKTVQKGEHHFLRKLLPGYYMNLVQNKRTLLPKFFGLYSYQSSLGRNIRFIIMNNLLPSHLTYYETYDLKGSTFRRRASERELRKKRPTLKDLDFNDRHPDHLKMIPATYEKLIQTMRRDVRVLESFKIMDYSLLVGLHNTVTDTDTIQDGHESDDDFSATTFSAHQSTINKSAGLQLQSAMQAQSKSKPCRYRTPPTATLVVSSSSCDGLKDYDGLYDRMKDNDRIAFMLRPSPDQGDKNRFIIRSADGSQWFLSPSLQDREGNSAAARLRSDVFSPDMSLAPWEVPREGSWAIDKDVAVVALRSNTTTGEKQLNRRSSISYSTMSEQIDSDLEEDNSIVSVKDAGRLQSTKSKAAPHGGLVAYNSKGEKLIAFLGIIDILQNYMLKKKMEHTFKSIVYDGDTVSVHKPGFYAKRFQDYMTGTVFQPFTEALGSKFDAKTNLQLARPMARHISSSRSPARTGNVSKAEKEKEDSQISKARASPAAVRKLLSMPYEVDEEDEEDLESPPMRSHLLEPPRIEVVTPAVEHVKTKKVLVVPVAEPEKTLAVDEQPVLASTPKRGDIQNSSLQAALANAAIDVSFGEAADAVPSLPNFLESSPPQPDGDASAGAKFVQLSDLSIELEDEIV